MVFITSVAEFEDLSKPFLLPTLSMSQKPHLLSSIEFGGIIKTSSITSFGISEILIIYKETSMHFRIVFAKVFGSIHFQFSSVCNFNIGINESMLGINIRN